MIGFSMLQILFCVTLYLSICNAFLVTPPKNNKPCLWTTTKLFPPSDNHNSHQDTKGSSSSKLRLSAWKNSNDNHNVDPEQTQIQDSKRRFFFTQTTSTTVAALAASVGAIMNPSPSMAAGLAQRSRTEGYAIQKSESEWQSMLSVVQYDILRNGGTERPYSSILEGEERPGMYVCAGCGTPLFESNQKFHSGTGWPSYARPLEGVEMENVNAATLNLMGAEVRCQTCGGHLGDVFTDGFLFVGTPAFTSGKRYCIDGAALAFVPKDGSDPVLGDKSPLPKKKSEPDWLAPPKINAR